MDISVDIKGMRDGWCSNTRIRKKYWDAITCAGQSPISVLFIWMTALMRDKRSFLTVVSPITGYLYSTDFYGPFNMNELKVQMHKLGIPLPMRLYGIYDRYVCNFSDEPEPKAFYWPHHHRREGTLIE